MKRVYSINKTRSNFEGFSVLTSEEMFKVRGGGDIRPATRDLDIFEDDPTRNTDPSN